MESETVYDVFHLVSWNWRIAMDLFLGGMGIGAFLFAMFVSYGRKGEELLVTKIGSVLAPIGVAAGLLFMLFEMGRPFRIFNTMIHFNRTSTLSWGGVLQLIFLVLSAIYAYLILFERNKAVRQKIGLATTFFAVFVGFYHGFLLSFVTARPLWNAAASSVVSIMSFMTTGIAAVLLGASLTEKGRREIAELFGMAANTLLVAILIQLAAIFIWMVSLARGKADFVNAFNTLNREFGFQFWGIAVVVGLCVPFVLLATRKCKAIVLPITGALVLLGGYVFRHVLIICGQIS